MRTAQDQLNRGWLPIQKRRAEVAGEVAEINARAASAVAGSLAIMERLGCQPTEEDMGRLRRVANWVLTAFFDADKPLIRQHSTAPVVIERHTDERDGSAFNRVTVLTHTARRYPFAAYQHSVSLETYFDRAEGIYPYSVGIGEEVVRSAKSYETANDPQLRRRSDGVDAFSERLVMFADQAGVKLPFRSSPAR